MMDDIYFRMPDSGKQSLMKPELENIKANKFDIFLALIKMKIINFHPLHRFFL